MSFTFNNTIPAAGNNPSADQPIMLSNNVAIQGILGVDHITFNQSNGGQHLQVTLPATTYVVPPAQVGNASVIYPNAGTASAAAAQIFYVNSLATTQLSAIRAWAFCRPAGVVAGQSVNVVSVVRTSLGQYAVTLTANAVSSSNFAILVSNFIQSKANGTFCGSQITGVGTFNLNFLALNVSGYTDPADFSFAVLQI